MCDPFASSSRRCQLPVRSLSSDPPTARDLPLQMPKNGVVADRHAKALHQPLSRPATRPVTEKMNKLSSSIGAAAARTNNLRQPVRKCQALAFPVQTSPAAHLYPQRNGGALRRKVLKMSDISTVPAARLLATFRTDAYSRSYGRN
jgi:hypothetical protein